MRPVRGSAADHHRQGQQQQQQTIQCSRCFFNQQDTVGIVAPLLSPVNRPQLESNSLLHTQQQSAQLTVERTTLSLKPTGFSCEFQARKQTGTPYLNCASTMAPSISSIDGSATVLPMSSQSGPRQELASSSQLAANLSQENTPGYWSSHNSHNTPECAQTKITNSNYSFTGTISDNVCHTSEYPTSTYYTNDQDSSRGTFYTNQATLSHDNYNYHSGAPSYQQTNNVRNNNNWQQASLYYGTDTNNHCAQYHYNYYDEEQQAHHNHHQQQQENIYEKFTAYYPVANTYSQEHCAHNSNLSDRQLQTNQEMSSTGNIYYANNSSYSHGAGSNPGNPFSSSYNTSAQAPLECEPSLEASMKLQAWNRVTGEQVNCYDQQHTKEVTREQVPYINEVQSRIQTASGSIYDGSYGNRFSQFGENRQSSTHETIALQEQVQKSLSGTLKRRQVAKFNELKVEERHEQLVSENKKVTTYSVQLEKLHALGPKEVKSPASSPQSIVANVATFHRANQCSVCGRNYARPSTLKTHLRTHTNERPFKCNVCLKTFSQAANLTAHQRVHTGERPFSCPICSRQFSQSSSVITHLRTHSGERPYRCNMCNRTFSDSSTLTKHCRIHSGEKPYQCDYCPLNFSQSGNLSRHLKLHLTGPSSQRSAVPSMSSTSNSASTLTGSSSRSSLASSPNSRSSSNSTVPNQPVPASDYSSGTVIEASDEIISES